MNKKTKLLVSVIAFVFIIVLVKLGYDSLSGRTSKTNVSTSNNTNEKDDDTSSNEKDDDTSSDKKDDDTSSDKKNSSTKVLDNSGLTLAPDFTIKDLSGNSVTLSSLRGKTVVLNFWATWCGYCKLEMPDFDDYYKSDIKNSSDTLFYAVDMTDGQRDTESSVREFINDAGYSFPVLLDQGQKVSANYNIRSIPTTIVINKDGYIYHVFNGQINSNQLNSVLKELQ